MQPDIIIREYSPSDYQDIVNAKYPFNLLDLKSQHGWKGWISRIIYFLARLDKKVFAAYSTKDRKTVGIVTLTKISDRIWGFWNIFVSPSHRRRGISSQLYIKCFEYLKNKGVKKLVGTVEIENIASIRSMEKNSFRFLSQKFCLYSGTIPRKLRQKPRTIAIRHSRSSDIDSLFQIYNKCTEEDWNKSLEITKKNFLDNFIGNLYGKGFSKLLFAKRILIAEHNEKIAGYVIVTRKRFLQKIPDTATLFLFLPPQISYEVGASFISEILSNLGEKGVKKISIYSHAHNKDTTKKILTDLNMIPTTLMVPIIELDFIPQVGDVQSKCSKRKKQLKNIVL